MDRLPQVVLVRHGDTEWTKTRRHTGSTDIPLTDSGRAQAETLRGALAGRDFARVLTSPLQRAIETSRLAGLDDGAERRAELTEWDYGDYEGETTADIRKTTPDWSLWRDGCPGGESAADIGARVDPVIAELRGLEADAAIVAHGHLLRVFAARWIEQAAELGGRLGLSTAAVSVLGWEREVPVLWLWNEAGQVQRA